MLTKKELLNLQTEIYEMLLETNDIVSMYYDAADGSVLFDWKNSKTADIGKTIEIAFVSKTKVALKLNFKVSTSTNVPVLYNRISDDLDTLLGDHKLKLDDLRLSIIDAR